MPRDPRIGEVVLYGLGSEGTFEYRPLMVLRVWPDEGGPGVPGVNGVCFVDGENDRGLVGAPSKGHRKKKDDEKDEPRVDDEKDEPRVDDEKDEPRVMESAGTVGLTVWVTSAVYSGHLGGAGTWHYPGELEGETRRGDLERAAQQEA
jgi:hypothetical protein